MTVAVLRVIVDLLPIVVTLLPNDYKIVGSTIAEPGSVNVALLVESERIPFEARYLVLMVSHLDGVRSIWIEART